MAEREIRRTEWREFCEGFTRRHRGWIVTVEALEGGGARRKSRRPEGPRRRLADGEPLQTLTAVPNPHGMSLLMQVGGAEGTTRVLVSQPERLRVQQTSDGADAGLCIDSADGQTTRVAFRVAAHPEEMNGLSQSETGEV